MCQASPLACFEVGRCFNLKDLRIAAGAKHALGRMAVQLAETTPELLVFLGREVLIPEYQHHALQKELLYGLDVAFAEGGKIEARDFGSELWREGLLLPHAFTLAQNARSPESGCVLF